MQASRCTTTPRAGAIFRQKSGRGFLCFSLSLALFPPFPFFRLSRFSAFPSFPPFFKKTKASAEESCKLLVYGSELMKFSLYTFDVLKLFRNDNISCLELSNGTLCQNNVCMKISLSDFQPPFSHRIEFISVFYLQNQSQKS